MTTPERVDPGAEPALVWAERVSRQLLEPLERRWRHTLGVAERARLIGAALGPDAAVVLCAAAYLHDIGYAAALAQTGFHPLDGARFVRAAGYERLAGLVAYHSGALVEAQERGLQCELADFSDERSLVARALTYCDLTTDPNGRLVEPLLRLREIRRRYAPLSIVGRAIRRSEPALLAQARDVEALLDPCHRSPVSASRQPSNRPTITHEP